MWNDRFTDPCALAGRAAFKNMFGGGGGTAAPAAPTPTPPPVMPDPLGPTAIAAGNKAAAANRGGRNSTVLTTAMRAGQTLAGAYGGNKLGAA